MKRAILAQSLGKGIHPAVASLECFKLIASMEEAIGQDHQAEATVGLLETIAKVEDPGLANDLVQQVAVLQGADPDQVSLESLGDLISTIRSLFGSKKKTKTDTGENKEPKHYRELMEFLNKYYLNSSWLSKQTFRTGTVSGVDLAEALTRNNKFDPVTFSGDLTKYAAEFKSFFTKYTAAVRKHSDQIQAIDEQLVKDVKALDENQADYKKQVIQLVRTATKKMIAVPDPVKLVGAKFKLLGNRQTSIKQWRYSGDPGSNCDGAVTEVIREVNPVDQVPVVDQKDVKALVDAVISLYETIKTIDESFPNWCDHSDDDHEFMTVVEDEDTLLWSQYGTNMYWQGQSRRLLWDLKLGDSTSKAVIAVLKWIDRSIDGE